MSTTEKSLGGQSRKGTKKKEEHRYGERKERVTPLGNNRRESGYDRASIQTKDGKRFGGLSGNKTDVDRSLC